MNILTILTTALSYWRGLSIAILSLTIYLGYNHYSKKIEILELKVTNAELNETRCLEQLENQNKRIEDASESTKELVKEAMEELSRKLGDLTQTQRDQLADIIDTTIPMAD